MFYSPAEDTIQYIHGITNLGGNRLHPQNHLTALCEGLKDNDDHETVPLVIMTNQFQNKKSKFHLSKKL